MRIRGLKTVNYRTLETLELEFPGYYTAICGKNDSGKTNVVRALRAIVKEEALSPFGPDPDVSFENDFTRWKSGEAKSREIRLEITFEVGGSADAGLIPFLEKQLSLSGIGDGIDLHVELRFGEPTPAADVEVVAKGQRFGGLAAQEVLKKLQSSQVILFYNSTELDPRMYFGRGLGFLKEAAGRYSTRIAEIKDGVNRKLSRITKGHQKQLEDLLGRLDKKYKISLSLPPFDFSYLPYNVSLGQGKYDVSLDEWGSGTRNRTLILLTLFRAREISQSGTTAGKITPCIVVEEPESFLHPSAQAAFGRVLQDLAAEFQVQVITTTHSPYMLSLDRPESNILLDREAHRGQVRETVRLQTSDEDWMRPFGAALGIDGAEFAPWRNVFFGKGEAILLVEGETDKEYFEMLRDPCHGANQLRFEGGIFAYGGTGALKQTILLKFIRDRYPKMFVTFDKDAEGEVVQSLTALGLQKGKHFLAVGEGCGPLQMIEGLLPTSVRSTVQASHSELVDQAIHGSAKQKRQASHELKKLYCHQFKAEAKPWDDYFKNLYRLAKVINKALA